MIDANNNVEYYIYGPKGIVAKRSNNLTYFMLKDHLGSMRVVMNSQNQIVSSYDYDAWGNPLNNTVSEESKYRYTGREFDDEAGLHNFRARLYDSVLMRFYQVDPAEQFASPYVYCGNNPITLMDANGKYLTASGNQNDIDNFVNNYPIPLKFENGSVKYNGSTNNISKMTNDQFYMYLLINDEKHTVNLNFNDGLQYPQMRLKNSIPNDVVAGDRYNGSTKLDNGRTIANTSIHLKSVDALSSISDESISDLITHAVNESYYMTSQFPGKSFSYSRHKKGHNFATSLQTNTSAHKCIFKFTSPLESNEFTNSLGVKEETIFRQRYKWINPLTDEESEEVNAMYYK